LTAKLTYDHVVPVARGGQTSWENIVTSCLACNRRKGNRTPEEAGLRLLKRPLAPLGFPAKVQLVLARVQAPDAWKQYIFC
jgi:5-methylcytosine-specific restriction endonuclease McrA